MSTLTSTQQWGRESSPTRRATEGWVAKQRNNPTHKPLLVVHLLPAVLLVLWLNSGATDVLFRQIPGSYKWGIALVWLFISVLFRGSIANLARAAIPLGLYLAFLVTTVQPSDPQQAAILQTMGYVTVAYCLFSFYSRPEVARSRSFIAYAVLMDMLFVAVKTWRELDATPQISRILATGMRYEDLRAQTAALWGVGGYAYAYSLPPILLVLAHFALTRPRGRWIYWTLVGAGTLLVVKMAFTIAILMWLAAFGYLVLTHRLGQRHRLAVPLLAGVGVAVAVLAGPPILTILAGTELLPEVINVRLVEMADSLAGAHDQGSDLGIRSDQYMDSWHEFSVNWVTGSMGAGRGLGQTGGHSAWLDTLGTMGITGLFLFWFLYLVYRRQVNLVDSSDRRVIHIAWAYFAVLGMINTVLFPQLLVVWFCVIPFLLSGRRDAPPSVKESQE